VPVTPEELAEITSFGCDVISACEVVASRGGSGGVTGPCASLCRCEDSGHGETVLMIGAVTDEVAVACLKLEQDPPEENSQCHPQKQK
jgi:hypothetical protein